MRQDVMTGTQCTKEWTGAGEREHPQRHLSGQGQCCCGKASLDRAVHVMTSMSTWEGYAKASFRLPGPPCW